MSCIPSCSRHAIMGALEHHLVGCAVAGSGNCLVCGAPYDVFRDHVVVCAMNEIVPTASPNHGGT